MREYSISKVEIAVKLISMILGVGILTLPRGLAVETGTADGWISIIISGLLVILLLLFYVRIQRKFPSLTLLEFLAQGRLGKVAAKVLAFLFIIYFLFSVCYVIRMLSVVVKIYLLEQTPPEMIVGLVVLTSAYAVSKGLQGIIH
jgi:spore germination protein